MLARGEHRPLKAVPAEQSVCGRFHEHQIFEIGADPAQYAEDHLDEERRLYRAAIDEMSEIIEVPDIITFMLEPRTCFAHRLKNRCDVAEGVAEDEVVRAEDVILLPIMFPAADPFGGGEHRKVDRPHVERTHFGLETDGRAQTLGKGASLPNRRW